MVKREAFPRDADDHLGKFVDRDHPISTEVDRLTVVGLHETVDSFDAIVYEAERTRLLAIAPDLD